MNFVAEWTTMSAPCSIGRSRYGVAKVESTTSGMPCRCAAAAAASMSISVAFRIADRLDKDSARPVVDGVFKGVFRVRIDKGGGDAVLRERVREQVVRAAVDGFGGDDVVTRLREVEEGVGDCRRTGGYAERCGAAFERRDAFSKISTVVFVRRP